MSTESVNETKKFFFFKVKDDFAEDERIDFILSQKNGGMYFSVFFLLCLESIRTQGRLVYQIKDRVIPYDAEKIRRELKYFDLDTIMVSLDLFRSVGLIEVDQEGSMNIPMIPDMIKTEAANANALRQKRFKERQKEKALLAEGQQLALTDQENTTKNVTKSNAKDNEDNVTQSVTESVTETLPKITNNLEPRTKNLELRDYKSITYNSQPKREEIRENTLSDDALRSFEEKNKNNFFKTFLEKYPKVTDASKVKFVEEAWNEHAAGREEEVLAALDDNLEWNDSWKLENGRYIPGAEKWLRNEEFLNFVAKPKDPEKFYEEWGYHGN